MGLMDLFGRKPSISELKKAVLVRKDVHAACETMEQNINLFNGNFAHFASSNKPNHWKISKLNHLLDNIQYLESIFNKADVDSKNYPMDRNRLVSVNRDLQFLKSKIKEKVEELRKL